MIKVNQLYFSYTKDPFIENMNFDVKQGEILGFLGPSGAGKSTLQKILIGMLKSYRGNVTISDIEVKTHTNEFYENIGIDFEFPSLYDKLTARQNLEFFGSLYRNKTLDINILLSSVGLLRDADKKISEYSKGMKSRLNFIKALLHDPDILFLDEPTSGLDPINNKIMKDIILAEKARGKTIIITTHNMQDATDLCDRVAFIVNGKIKALDSPHNLIMQKGAGLIQYSYLEQGTEKTITCSRDNTAKDSLLNKLIAENKLLTIHSTEPDLGDIFIEVTGSELL